MSINSFQFDTGVLIRRSLFFLILIILTLGNLFTLFRGLNSPQAMDQAQIAREISRGNGFTTKFIRPVAYYQAKKTEDRSVPLILFKDTYHSPLNPLLNAAVLKIIGADDPDAWQMNPVEMVNPLDRVIATVSTLLFLMAIGVNYLLFSRIFDAKIAGVGAILMLFCETFWNFSLSGLPQMLMLLLFSCGIYFVYRAVEAAAEGRIAMTPAVIAGVFFTLLALTHWMTVWIALGYILFAAIWFRPRGIVGISILALLLIAAIGPMLRNQGITGSPFGTAFLTIYSGLGNGTEEAVMRSGDLANAPPIIESGLIGKILRTTLLQATNIIPFLAGIVVAPLFFLSLLHPFKRSSIATFRWAILLMWISTAFGLAIFGISTAPLDPNQLHLLFAPIMTAYGLAFISILWSRLDFVASTPALRNVHHMAIIVLCAFPLLLALPQKVRVGMHNRERGIPHWPPYFAPALNSKTTGLKGWVGPQQVVFSDQPWAVAWYADRLSIWLPPSREEFIKLQGVATDLQTPVVGIAVSPSSHGSGPIATVVDRYKDFAPLVLDGRILFATGFTIYERSPKIQDIVKRFPHRQSLVGWDMVYYSESAIRARDTSKNP